MVTEWPDLAINLWIMNIHYDLVNQFPIQQRVFVLFCFAWCFVFILFLFCFVVFVLFLFVYLFHTPQKLKWVMLAHKDIKTFEKMRNPKWRLRLSSTVIQWTYYFAGSFPNLSKPVDRWQDFLWIFLKVTKTLLGVINKGWALKVFWLSFKGVGLEQKLSKVFQWKLSLFIWFAMGLTYNFPVKKGGPEI